LSVYNHVPDVAKVEVRKTMAKIKDNAKVNSSIVASMLKGKETAVAGQLSPVRSIKQTVRRARRLDLRTWSRF